MDDDVVHSLLSLHAGTGVGASQRPAPPEHQRGTNPPGAASLIPMRVVPSPGLASSPAAAPRRLPTGPMPPATSGMTVPIASRGSPAPPPLRPPSARLHSTTSFGGSGVSDIGGHASSPGSHPRNWRGAATAERALLAAHRAGEGSGFHSGFGSGGVAGSTPAVARTAGGDAAAGGGPAAGSLATSASPAQSYAVAGRSGGSSTAVAGVGDMARSLDMSGSMWLVSGHLTGRSGSSSIDAGGGAAAIPGRGSPRAPIAAIAPPPHMRSALARGVLTRGDPESWPGPAPAPPAWRVDGDIVGSAAFAPMLSGHSGSGDGGDASGDWRYAESLPSDIWHHPGHPSQPMQAHRGPETADGLAQVLPHHVFAPATASWLGGPGHFSTGAGPAADATATSLGGSGGTRTARAAAPPSLFDAARAVLELPPLPLQPPFATSDAAADGAAFAWPASARQAGASGGAAIRYGAAREAQDAQWRGGSQPVATPSLSSSSSSSLSRSHGRLHPRHSSASSHSNSSTSSSHTGSLLQSLSSNSSHTSRASSSSTASSRTGSLRSPSSSSSTSLTSQSTSSPASSLASPSSLTSHPSSIVSSHGGGHRHEVHFGLPPPLDQRRGRAHARMRRHPTASRHGHASPSSNGSDKGHLDAHPHNERLDRRSPATAAAAGGIASASPRPARGKVAPLAGQSVGGRSGSDVGAGGPAGAGVTRVAAGSVSVISPRITPPLLRETQAGIGVGGGAAAAAERQRATVHQGAVAGSAAAVGAEPAGGSEDAGNDDDDRSVRSDSSRSVAQTWSSSSRGSSHIGVEASFSSSSSGRSSSSGGSSRHNRGTDRQWLVGSAPSSRPSSMVTGGLPPTAPSSPYHPSSRMSVHSPSSSSSSRSSGFGSHTSSQSSGSASPSPLLAARRHHHHRAGRAAGDDEAVSVVDLNDVAGGAADAGLADYWADEAGDGGSGSAGDEEAVLLQPRDELAASGVPPGYSGGAGTLAATSRAVLTSHGFPNVGRGVDAARAGLSDATPHRGTAGSSTGKYLAPLVPTAAPSRRKRQIRSPSPPPITAAAASTVRTRARLRLEVGASTHSRRPRRASIDSRESERRPRPAVSGTRRKAPQDSGRRRGATTTPTRAPAAQELPPPMPLLITPTTRAAADAAQALAAALPASLTASAVAASVAGTVEASLLGAASSTGLSQQDEALLRAALNDGDAEVRRSAAVIALEHEALMRRAALAQLAYYRLSTMRMALVTAVRSLTSLAPAHVAAAHSSISFVTDAEAAMQLAEPVLMRGHGAPPRGSTVLVDADGRPRKRRHSSGGGGHGVASDRRSSRRSGAVARRAGTSRSRRREGSAAATPADKRRSSSRRHRRHSGDEAALPAKIAKKKEGKRVASRRRLGDVVTGSPGAGGALPSPAAGGTSRRAAGAAAIVALAAAAAAAAAAATRDGISDGLELASAAGNGIHATPAPSVAAASPLSPPQRVPRTVSADGPGGSGGAVLRHEGGDAAVVQVAGHKRRRPDGHSRDAGKRRRHGEGRKGSKRPRGMEAGTAAVNEGGTAAVSSR